MSILANILGTSQVATGEKRSTNSWWLDGFLLGNSSTSGIGVTPESALTSSAVFACVRILAETLASLPLITYERRGRARERATDFYLYPILHDEPNEWMTSFEFRETVQGHLALWGNAYSQIEYDKAGRVKSIFPLRPDRMMDIKIENGVKMYQYQLPNGEFIWLGGERIWHLKAFGDGLFGYSPVQLMRNAIGLTLAMEKFGAKFFGNGARPGGVLEHPGKLGEEAQKRLRASWNEMHSGLDNSHKVAILEEGLKWHEVGIPPDDAQYLDGRKFQGTEIARIYRVPPHMIADLDKATFSNIEHQSQEFLNYTMLPWTTRWEQSIRKYLLLESERKRYYVEFLVDGLLRGDMTARTAYYSTGRNWGWLSVNDIREKENMNPVEDGDVYLQPLNMIPAGSEEPGPGEEGRSVTGEVRSAEVRATDAEKKEMAKRRLYIARSYRPVLQDAGERSLNREAKEIKQALANYIAKGDIPGFNAWKEEYYKNIAEVIKKMWKPAFYGLGTAINAAAAKEVGGPVGLTPGLDECLLYHLDRSIARSILVSSTSLDTILQKKSGDDDEIIENITDMVDKWPENRAASFATWEATRISGLMTKATYFYNDVSEMEWVQLDENPFCSNLDGETLEMGDSCRGSHWAPKGSSIGALSETWMGKRSDLKVSWNVATPPLFDGCECQIVASKKKERI